MQHDHEIAPAHVKRVRVTTFHEAVRLNCRFPQSTEEAQYSLPFPLAAALVHGRLGVAELTGAGLTDPAVGQLVERVEMNEAPEYNQRFPAKRLARVEIETLDGGIFNSGDFEADWEAGSPPSDSELIKKFRRLAGEQLPDDRAEKLEHAVWHCEELPELSKLLTLLMPPRTKD